MNKLKVGVLMGGKSIEREVSFNSGRTVCDHLDTARYQVIPLFISVNRLYILPLKFLYRGKISDFEYRLKSEAQEIKWDDLKEVVDFVYIAMHGRYAEDGTIQGFLEVLQIPYLGSKVLASAIGMDKIIQKEILNANEILVPKWITFYPHQIENSKFLESEIINELEKKGLAFPLVVKPHHEGSSLGVKIVENYDCLINAINIASNIDPLKKQPVIVEEKITGMEFTCIIITDYKTGKLIPLPPTEIVFEQGFNYYNYEQKYMPGRATKYTPARCSLKNTELIQKTCIDVMKLLDFTNLCRIDGFLTNEGQVYITDPNSFSGMAPSSFFFTQAAEIDMSHTKIINHLIETELESYGKQFDLIQNNIESFNNHKKTRIAVLFGGKSNEKEISLESGRNIFYKLSPYKYQAIPVFLDSNLNLYKIDQKLLVRNSTHEISVSLKPEMKISWQNLAEIADFVFIALHGGEGENGCIQGTLEILGIPYNGSSVLASALCMDKYKTNEYLKIKNFDVPKSQLVSKKEFESNSDLINQIILDFGFPLIVKPHDDGCSVLVSKATTQQDLNKSLKQIFDSNKNHALVEEFVKGMELTVGVIGNDIPKAMPPSRAVAQKEILSIEEKFLPGAGENQTPAPLPETAIKFVQNQIEQVYKSIGCKGYARIDCFYQNENESPTSKERLVILEINTLPGMTPATCIFHQAAEIGIQPMDFIDLMIKLGFEEHNQLDKKEEMVKQREQENQLQII
ncbi:ATP-grasp domain-containing protein [Candidatus Dependentiae bacterium]|nr:ATP-grasp domain-containing protein [Candidatus Dependentiae bacterium]